ncbi:exosortase C-terminal domain/associated protein EpsI [Derxia lacustris]|uniref:exosortase C-terminal domain/associated protein EpsI n=1 Tax=Derxia lacustris TaxID=764842 RepID=UPI001594891D|nr:exosortase C-terminal domain/associated protein EpsI [Derxia lacustris]
MLLGIVLLCALCGYLSRALVPADLKSVDSVALDRDVPLIFDGWKVLGLATGNPMLIVGGDSTDQPYDQVLYRTYGNANGQVLSLAIAWGQNQRQEVKIHRPELCYAAQGYTVSQVQPAQFDIRLGDRNRRVPGKLMVAESRGPGGRQLIAYWIRIGSLFSENAVETRIHLIAEGLAGRIPDGVLLRASVAAPDPADDAQTAALLSGFLTGLVEHAPRELQQLALGNEGQ